MYRFYCPQLLDSSVVELTGDESHHLSRVLRLTPGQRVELFDGRGSAVDAEIIEFGKTSTILRLLGEPAVAASATPRISLVTAAPKADRLRSLIEKATELSVDRVTLIETARSIVHPGKQKLERLTQTVIGACKQCGRNDLMAIDGPRPLSDVMVEVPKRGSMLLMAVPNAPLIADRVSELSSLSPVVIAIGPEGGWTQDEISDAAANGAVTVGLGPSILRVETAAIAAVCALRLGNRDTR